MLCFYDHFTKEFEHKIEICFILCSWTFISCILPYILSKNKVACFFFILHILMRYKKKIFSFSSTFYEIHNVFFRPLTALLIHSIAHTSIRLHTITYIKWLFVIFHLKAITIRVYSCVFVGRSIQYSTLNTYERKYIHICTNKHYSACRKTKRVILLRVNNTMISVLWVQLVLVEQRKDNVKTTALPVRRVEKKHTITINAQLSVETRKKTYLKPYIYFRSLTFCKS